MSSFQIRKATPEDVPQIFQFIQELAEFEKLSHEVKSTVESLRQTIFSDQPVAYVVMAEEDSKPVGFCLYFFNYSTFLAQPGLYIEDLYVSPQFRSKGYGLKFLQYLAQEAHQKGCGRMEWSVLDWNEGAIRFYERLGARAQSDWKVYRLQQSEFLKI